MDSNLNKHCHEQFNDFSISHVKQEDMSQNHFKSFKNEAAQEYDFSKIVKEEYGNDDDEDKLMEFENGDIKIAKKENEESEGTMTFDSPIKTEEIHIKTDGENSNLSNFHTQQEKDGTLEESEVQSWAVLEHKKTIYAKSQNDIKKVLQKEPNETYKCNECSYKTQKKNYLRKHIHEEHKRSENGRLLRCLESPYQSVFRKNLIMQIKLSHKPSSTNYKLLKCELCEYETYINSYMKRHYLYHHSRDGRETFKCNSCSLEFICKNSFQKHIHNNRSNKYKCDKCNFVTPIKVSLKKHMTVHQNKPLFTCVECLACHEPQESDLYHCPHCYYQVSHKPTFHKHLLDHHNKEKN